MKSHAVPGQGSRCSAVVDAPGPGSGWLDMSGWGGILLLRQGPSFGGFFRGPKAQPASESVRLVKVVPNSPWRAGRERNGALRGRTCWLRQGQRDTMKPLRPL